MPSGPAGFASALGAGGVLEPGERRENRAAEIWSR